jgi:hypothetical protein
MKEAARNRTIPALGEGVELVVTTSVMVEVGAPRTATDVAMREMIATEMIEEVAGVGVRLLQRHLTVSLEEAQDVLAEAVGVQWTVAGADPVEE